MGIITRVRTRCRSDGNCGRVTVKSCGNGTASTWPTYIYTKSWDCDNKGGRGIFLLVLVGSEGWTGLEEQILGLA